MSVGSDVLALGRLGVAGLAGLTDIVESMHGTIAKGPLPFGGRAETRTRGITRIVYQSIRGVTWLVGGSLEAVAPLLPAGAQPSPTREVVISALNGVLGDHLAATRSPLAIPMRLRELGTAARSSRVLVLVHGLCMNHAHWLRRGHHHGEALARELGFTPLVLDYNTGRHISTNGRELASHLDHLVETWPVPVEELVIVGHSMGGLVARSACHYGSDQRWMNRLSTLVFLGSPHHGAPLERAGNVLEGLLELSPYAAPLARLGSGRSAGITDLRFGNLLDEDWAAQHPRHRHDPRTPVPLPAHARCHAIAGTKNRLAGDGLVPVASALGQHADPAFALAFTASRVVENCSHFDLLDAPEVVEQMVTWLR
jgi:pimeloyl-ACP methyl ester carboxylesterase